MSSFTRFFFSVAVVLVTVYNAHAQWQWGIDAGAAVPITGYSKVVKTGWLAGIDVKYRTSKSFLLGLEATIARFGGDKNAGDEFQDARLTIAPVVFVAEKEFGSSVFRPYVAAGLGISFFNLHYEISPTEGHSDNNVSFTMTPQAGLKYDASDQLSYYFETDLLLLADGPPAGLPMGEKMTGYWGVKLGICYRLKM